MGQIKFNSVFQVLNDAVKDDDGVFKHDFMSLLTQINKKVSDKEQVPVVVSRLTQAVHFQQKDDVGPSEVKRAKE